MVIGTDFDNTIVSYARILHSAALKREWISASRPADKRTIRDAVRQLPDGENKWQELQSHIYGPGMAEAELIPDVAEFFRMCRDHAIPIYIVSHKTPHASKGPRDVNLHETAFSWMEAHSFFDPSGFGLNREQVFFEPTRQDKLARIDQLHCTHFIDDLEETFLESGFPRDVERILFDPMSSRHGNWRSFRAWSDIRAYFRGLPA